MSYALAAIIVTRAAGQVARVRTIPLTNPAASARRELLAAIRAEHRAPFLEAEDDAEEGRQVDPAAFVDLEVAEEIRMVNGTELAESTYGHLMAARDHVLAARARGDLVEAFVELTI